MPTVITALSGVASRLRERLRYPTPASRPATEPGKTTLDWRLRHGGCRSKTRVAVSRPSSRARCSTHADVGGRMQPIVTEVGRGLATPKPDLAERSFQVWALSRLTTQTRCDLGKDSQRRTWSCPPIGASVGVGEADSKSAGPRRTPGKKAGVRPEPYPLYWVRTASFPGVL